MYIDGWTAEDLKNALAYLKSFETFEFIFCLVTLQHSLSVYLKNAVIKIQGKDQDFISGMSAVHNKVEGCRKKF